MRTIKYANAKHANVLRDSSRFFISLTIWEVNYEKAQQSIIAFICDTAFVRL